MGLENRDREIKELIHRKKQNPGIVKELHIHHPFLVHVNLSENGIQSLPPSFFNLVFLRHLNLSYNKLESLPTEFEKLKDLNYLDLCSNCISGIKISQGFFNLSSLRHLHLSDNNLESIPHNICNLVALRVLGLRNTGLKILNYNIFRVMPRLREIHLQGNYLTHL
nr:ras suppressor protein 1-like [Lepeophtheirus salmonis]